jgi:hypothetical protein
MTTLTPASTWISSIAYRAGYLAVFIAPDHCPNSQVGRIPVAMLYAGTPSWLPGLLAAGTGRRSVGLAYNRLLKGRYAYQRIEGAAKIAELRKLMTEVQHG